jgi:thiol-disulfide isomerase/thioredoxin
MEKYLKLFVFVTLLLLGCNTNNSKSSEGQSADAVTLDDIKLSDLDGSDINMSEFKNKTVFINFWATWCKPCIREMPAIANAQAQLKDKNVVFLLASNESAEQIQGFKERRKFEFRYVLVHNLEALGIQALPATYIFDPKGHLTFSEAGFRIWDTSENINLITKNSNP